MNQEEFNALCKEGTGKIEGEKLPGTGDVL
jgi:hypothetical protein